jgi:hypothetical protein
LSGDDEEQNAIDDEREVKEKMQKNKQAQSVF